MLKGGKDSDFQAGFVPAWFMASELSGLSASWGSW